MGLVDSGSAYDDTVIPQDMYEGTYEELHTYRREDDELRLNLVFRVKYEDGEVEKVFNTPNKLSINPDAQSSKLGKLFESLELEEEIDEELGADGALMKGNGKFIIGEVPEDVDRETEEQEESDIEKLREALHKVLSGKKFRLYVVKDDGENGSRNYIEGVSGSEEFISEQKSEQQKEEVQG
jgi:hypothetical protein